MADSCPITPARCSVSASAKEKGMKGPGSELAAEEVETDKAAQDCGGVDREKSAATAKKKWRVPQDMIDFILSWDVSDYVFKTPDNMDDMPISEETKKRYRDERKDAVALMQKRRSIKRQMQEWVRAELEKNGGYIEIETTAEKLAEHQLEDYIAGQSA